jgi:hypothetical protein
MVIGTGQNGTWILAERGEKGRADQGEHDRPHGG